MTAETTEQKVDAGKERISEQQFKLPENGDVSKILKLILEINPTRDQAEIINRACAKFSLITHPNRTLFRVCQVIPGENRKRNKMEDVGKEAIISVENGELSEFGKKFLFKKKEV